jgi:hypothetical protein
MAIAFRILRLYALALWVGGLVFFVMVANVAFQTMPTPVLAGQIVRGSLLNLHRLGVVTGVLYLLFTLALLATRRDGHPLRIAELALAAAMIALTLYSQMSIIPRMETDRLTLGGDVTKSGPGNRAYDDFQRLHQRSTQVEGLVLLMGLVALAFAPIHGREEYVPPPVF